MRPRLTAAAALLLLTAGCVGGGRSTARDDSGAATSPATSPSPASSTPPASATSATNAGTSGSTSSPRPASTTRSATSSTTSTGPSNSATSSLAAQLGEIAATAVDSFGGTAGIAVAAPFSTPTAGGTWSTGPAWSTAKVPVAIAALADNPGDDNLRTLASSAIRLSDNDAAEQLWASLGEPQTAGTRTQAVVRELGDRHTVVQWQRIRPPFTAFGQTQWALTDAAVAAAGLPCRASAGPVLDLMGRIDPSQAFGLGHVPGARFKGGWGPDPAGRYLTRQLGVIDTAAGHVGVALAAQPASGSFEAGQGALSLMADRLAARLDRLPAAPCAG
ncbi:MAG: hypothetical protein V9G19_01655 [Tetrasphaera sp.]